MDSTEKVVSAHLASRGFTDVLYHPDGDVTPDFLVNRKIAIEARRLNQNHFTESETKCLEEIATPLRTKIPELLRELGTPV